MTKIILLNDFQLFKKINIYVNGISVVNSDKDKPSLLASSKLKRKDPDKAEKSEKKKRRLEESLSHSPPDQPMTLSPRSIPKHSPHISPKGSPAVSPRLNTENMAVSQISPSSKQTKPEQNEKEHNKVNS